MEYFGTEDEPECHMCFHFPVMPRIYYAIKDQRARQILDILADTPAIPAGAQWSTFLRNHDELTLEMVSTEERASMYGWFAPDPRMRANIGIRRRLAPLLDNSRKEIELAHALLLSLPGSPCLYYGDEIGMGDNIWLPDRDAVRTPMQWTPDRNAGFSTSDPGKLYLPVVQSLVSNYNHVNVEAQLAQPTSLLHWVHGMLAVRKRHPALGRGEFVAVRSRTTSPCSRSCARRRTRRSCGREHGRRRPGRRRSSCPSRAGATADRRVRRRRVPLGGRRRTLRGHPGLAGVLLADPHPVGRDRRATLATAGGTPPTGAGTRWTRR